MYPRELCLDERWMLAQLLSRPIAHRDLLRAQLRVTEVAGLCGFGPVVIVLLEVDRLQAEPCPAQDVAVVEAMAHNPSGISVEVFLRVDDEGYLSELQLVRPDESPLDHTWIASLQLIPVR